MQRRSFLKLLALLPLAAKAVLRSWARPDYTIVGAGADWIVIERG